MCLRARTASLMAGLLLHYAICSIYAHIRQPGQRVDYGVVRISDALLGSNVFLLFRGLNLGIELFILIAIASVHKLYID